MTKTYRSGLVFFVAAALCIVSAVSSGTALALDPNTIVSSDGAVVQAEAFAGRGGAGSPGTGRLLEGGPLAIPAEHLNAPSLDEVFGFASPESVIGTDGRVRVTATTSYPSRAIAYLFVRFPNSAGTCTGWFVGPRTVMTAGHCVYDTETNQWASSITVYPGRNGATAPYGSTTAHRLFSVTGWTTSHDHRYDYGAIQTNLAKGSTVGWFGYYWQTSNTFGVGTVRGYPGDKTAGTMWTMNGTIYATSLSPRKLFYYIDTAGGQSGSPIYRYFDPAGTSLGPGYYGLGIHAYGVPGFYPYSTRNSGTRITQGVGTNIYNWKRWVYP